MKFARRSESVKESRAIFKKAREDSRTNFHVGVEKAINSVMNEKSWINVEVSGEPCMYLFPIQH